MEVRASVVILLPQAPPSVAVARGRLVADLTAADIREAAIRDAVLVVSELLTNAIRHATPLFDSRVRVSWMVDDQMLEVAVSDGGGPSVPRLAHPVPSEPGGRGLGIVKSLAFRWGVQIDEDRTTVWAVLPAPEGGGSAGHRPVRRTPAAVGRTGGAEGTVVY